MTSSKQLNIEVVPREESDRNVQFQPLIDVNTGTVPGNNRSTALQTNRHCFLKSNTAALVLAWNFSVAIGLEFFFNPTSFVNYYIIYTPKLLLSIIVMMYAFSSFLFAFIYPLAGCLADTCWGRYKTIIGSLRFVLISIAMIYILGTFATVGTVPIFFFASDPGPLEGVKKVSTAIIFWVVISIPVVLGAMLIVCSLAAFSANVVQYGIDQLRESKDMGLYIFWYVWTVYLAKVIFTIPYTLLGEFYSYYFIWSIGTFLVLLPATISVIFRIKKCNKQWIFVAHPQDQNRYKLICRVIKFVITKSRTIIYLQNYDNNFEAPKSRFDFGKEKYGGPFTNKEVEEVKSCLQIFFILLTFGPVFLVDFAASKLLPNFGFHMNCYIDWKNDLLKSLISTGSLTPLIIVVRFPFCICLRQLRIWNYIRINLGALERIGLGMLFILLSTLCTLSIDTYGHARVHNTTKSCFLSLKINSFDNCYVNICKNTSVMSGYFLTIQSVLNAVGYTLFYISSFEFICVKSPQAMRGVLISAFFLIKGAFQILGLSVIFSPFTQWDLSVHTFPSCGFVYYLINVVILITGIVIFGIAARKYQRQGRIDYDNNIVQNIDDYQNIEGLHSQAIDAHDSESNDTNY